MLVDSKRLDDITNSIKEKLGDENIALISDDLGDLLSENSNTISTINDLNKKVSDMQEKNEMLVKANSRLLSQIPMEVEDAREQKEEKETPKSFNFLDAFDEKGHFKRRF